MQLESCKRHEETFDQKIYTQMINMHMQKDAVREIQIKVTMNYHTPVRISEI